MNRIKLVLADDHQLIREGFRALLGNSERFEIVGEAEDGAQLVEMTRRLQPDVVLADIHMPNLSGLEALKQLIAEFPLIRFIVITMHEEREYVLNAIRLGASGYVMKNVERKELEKAILTVHEGGKYFSVEVANILAESVSRPSTITELPEISPREKEVLGLVAQGLSTKLVADRLGISTRTVESHRINMLKKLKAGNTAELVRKAIELRIIVL
ncbi:MAG TPA: response regulator transcription factor [Cyclobacteriaceae bacterium]|nr:response regulator transcription factor [Cyclobacteriaceae bacterium]